MHRLPAVAAIIVTQEYLHFAREVVASHDKANMQAELDVAPAMGDMLADMQACLRQLCGASAVGDAETVAKLTAEKMASLNSCSAQGNPHDMAEKLRLSSSASVVIPSPQQALTPPESRHEAKRQRATQIRAPALYDTTGSIKTVALAGVELWPSGSTSGIICQML